MNHHNDQDTAGSYCVKRFYQGDRPAETIRTGLTLAEAQAWCNDPETSSSTATSAEAQARTEKHGPWFDGYESEDPKPLYGWPNWETREVALWLGNAPETLQWIANQIRNEGANDAFALSHVLTEKAPALIREEGSTLTDEELLHVDWLHIAKILIAGRDA